MVGSDIQSSQEGVQFAPQNLHQGDHKTLISTQPDADKFHLSRIFTTCMQTRRSFPTLKRLSKACPSSRSPPEQEREATSQQWEIVYIAVGITQRS